MEIYDYGKTKNCVIFGCFDGNVDKVVKMIVGNLHNLSSYKVETHPKELERQKRIAEKLAQQANGETSRLRQAMIQHPIPPLNKKQKPRAIYPYNLSDTVIIINGFNGFGTKDLKYYYDKLEMFNQVLSDNNSHVLFVRGNDDPKYFEDTLINLSNIKTIKDYSVIKLQKYNCLCIGGSISFDRQWKIEQEKRTGKKLYWENENLVYNEDEINKIIEKYNIACIVTPSCPTFAYPGTNSLKSSAWASADKSLVKDVAEERAYMDKIYNKILEHNKKPYMWAYSKYKCSNRTIINDILFYAVPQGQPIHFNECMFSFFKIDFSKDLKENNLSPTENSLNMKKGLSPWDDNSFVMNEELDTNDDATENVQEEVDDIEEDEAVANEVDLPNYPNPYGGDLGGQQIHEDIGTRPYYTIDMPNEPVAIGGTAGTPFELDMTYTNAVRMAYDTATAPRIVETTNVNELSDAITRRIAEQTLVGINNIHVGTNH